MASFNKVILVGNLGRDPELRYIPDGTAVCSFSLATNERKKSKSGDFQDVTTWFNVTLWRRQAEVASQYLSKGRQVYIEGRLSLREYQDRDGNTRTSLDVQGTEIQFIGSRGEEGSSPREPRPEASSHPSASAPPDAAVTEDDIPF
ncbi:MAG TPA: single-stranded DNA-binding protein [Blastocatellia bacterium]|nr:single-stranded DNA-binding protein [Blastocatellia bacterium]